LVEEGTAEVLAAAGALLAIMPDPVAPGSGQVSVRTFGQGWDRNLLSLIPRLNA